MIREPPIRRPKQWQDQGRSTVRDRTAGAAMAAISGESIGREGAVVDVIDVVLPLYSVIVFASLAGTIGAFFPEQRDSTASSGRDEGGDER